MLWKKTFLVLSLAYPLGGSFSESLWSLEDFQNDCKSIRERLCSAPVHDVPAPPTRELSRWKDYPDLPDLLEAIVDGYKSRPMEQLYDLCRTRETKALAADDPFVWLDAALLGSAKMDRRFSSDCFQRALASPAFVQNPMVYAQRGRELRKHGYLSDASIEYKMALQFAETSGDPAVLFRVRQMYADDLFDAGNLSGAVAVGTESLKSQYPLEKAWALAQNAVYRWALDDSKAVLKTVGELQSVLRQTSPREDLGWEKRRYKQVREVFEMMNKALGGDPVAQMAADVEALDIQYKFGDFSVGPKRMERWVMAYPLKDYSSWKDPGLCEWAVWAHYNYYASLVILGKQSEAESGFLDLIQYVPFEAAPGRIVEAYCWLGRIRIDQGFFDEAKEYLETGLAMDDSSGVLDGPTAAVTRVVKNGYLPKHQREEFVALYDFLVHIPKQEEVRSHAR